MAPLPGEYSRHHDQQDWSSNNSMANSEEQDEYDKSIAKGGVSVPFPWRLHQMLDAMDREGDYSIVQWQPHGRAFVVHDPKQFVTVIMPKYFNQTKYASFQRQLNLYGFNRLSHGQDKGSYFHRWFVRGERHLCRNMARQKIKGTKVRRSLTPEEEPNFYLPDWEKRLSNAEKHLSSSSSTAYSGTSRSTATKQNKRRSISSKTAASTTSKSSIPKKTSGTRSIKKAVANKEKPQSLVAMMRENPRPQFVSTQHSAFVPPAVIHTTPMPQGSDVQGGDLLFFEGLPFRYLDHMDEVPNNNLYQTPSQTHYHQHQGNTHLARNKDHLLSTISSIVTDTASWHD